MKLVRGLVGTILVCATLGYWASGQTSSTPFVADVVNEATGTGPVAPGSRVDIVGSNMIVLPTNSTITTAVRLNDILIEPTTITTSVRFNNIDGGVIWKTSGSFKVQVPFEIQPGTVRVDLMRLGQSVASRDIQVTATAPGLYAVTGTNQVAATDSQGALLTAYNPATPGQQIKLLVTGLGISSPSFPTATIPSSIATPLAATAVKIAGQSASILSRNYLRTNGLSCKLLGTCPDGTDTESSRWGIAEVVVTVPTGLPAGQHAIVVETDGRTSNTGYLPVFTAGTTPGCTYTLSGLPQGGNTGGNGTYGIATSLTMSTSAPTCTWNARSNSPFVTVFPLSGTGNATIHYTVYPNFDPAPRTAGTITVGTQSGTFFQAGATGTKHERFVRMLYFSCLGRMPSAAEEVFQASQLTAGVSWSSMAQNFLNSVEFNRSGRFIAGLYVGILNRNAEYGGWQFQRNALANGQINQMQLVSNFLTSGEYALRFGTPSDAEFVRLLYRHILLREGSQAEVDWQVGNIPSMGGRVGMAAAFLNAPEFRTGTGPRLTAFLLYSTLLMRDPTAAERALRESQIAGAKPLAAIVDELTGMNEFPVR